MPVKTVEKYAVLHSTSGTTRINIYFTDGTEDTYTDLQPARARLIVSILRNEKPVFWTTEQEILWTGREPQGEGERPFDLDAWLAARPLIRDNIIWEGSGGALSTYPGWSEARKNTLRDRIAIVLSGGGAGVEDPPPLAVVPAAGTTASTKLSSDTAWAYYVAYVAQSIVAEVSQFTRWSVTSLDQAQLRKLFDSRSLFRWEAASSTYVVQLREGAATPADPVKAFEFLVKNGLLASSRKETIERLLGWCRANMIHFSGGWEVENVYNQWQYKGLPPVSRTIAGTPDLSQPSWPNRHRTGGCWGTTGFLRTVLRTVNIPVELVVGGEHAHPHFMSEGLYLSHGDDPYNAMMKAVPEIPISLLPISATTYNEWYGSGVTAQQAEDNVGRRATQLGLEYLSNYLLHMRCQDISSGASHSAGKVYETLKRYWTVAQLESMDLWTKLDAKIASMGGCGSIPP